MVTKVESSNSTLLMTGCLEEGKSLIIQSTSSFHWELRLTNPLLDFRRSLPSYGEHELSAARCAPNLKQLEASTQASPAEIARALQSSTVIIDQDGGHFYLQEAKLHQCLDQVLMTISLQGWPPSAIPLKACAEIAAKHSSDVTIAAYCLKRFSHSISSSGRVNLDVRRITCELAKSLFATKKAYASTSALMVDLCDCLPAQIEPTISWLDGIISISHNGVVSLRTDN